MAPPKPTFSRRVLLRGLGGAVVAAPFLPSVAEREAKAQGMAAAAPRRLIVFFTHYGCLTDQWFPAKSHGPLAKADYAALNTLKPMAPLADKLLMVRGIRSMNEWSFDGALGQKDDPHAQACGSYFTCAPLTPNATNPIDPVCGPLFGCKPTARSLDHVCGEQINPKTASPLVLEIGGINTTDQAVISWSQPGQKFPGLGTPTQAFNGVSGLFGAGTMNPDTYRAARGKSVIDLVRADLNRLLGFNMSGADKQRLRDWVDLLHDTSGNVTAMCNMDFATNAMTGLGLTSDVLKAASVGGGSVDIGQAARVMLDVGVLSVLCDSSRVVVLKMPPNYVYKNLGLTIESHGISHRIGNANMGGQCLDGALDMIQKIDSFYAELFAYLVGRLDGIKEGDRTTLDNTATVWFQEMSDGNAHNQNNLPILQAGSCGGYFKTGWAINVAGAQADMSRGNSSSDCKDGQSPAGLLDSLGTPPEVASMPINKYFCNLMNAIGVKAGADGFPAVGGTAPVTKYGKYDDTKLFSDGGTADVTIKNPGEYAELRA